MTADDDVFDDARPVEPPHRAGVLAPLAAAVRIGHVRSAQLVATSFDLITRHRELGAVVALRRDGALEDARDIDSAVERGDDPGPLAGLPVLVKDIEDAAGMPTTFGSLLHVAAAAAAADGVVAGRLRSAGAIVVGKTNVPEFAFDGYTANLPFGATRNPWSLAHSPGGSSGGSGAALAAGLVPIATSTDVGGSVRIPASLCGLVGFKPTAGVIGRDPILASRDINSHGVLASTVADVRLLLDILAGPVEGDVGSPPRSRFDQRAVSRREVRFVAADRLVSRNAPSASVAAAFERAVASFADAVAQPIERIDPATIFADGYDLDDWFAIVGVEQAHRLGAETIRREIGRFEPNFGRAMLAALEISLPMHLAARQRRYRYAADLDALLGGSTVLLTPTLLADGWSPEGVLPGRREAGLPSWVYNTEPINLTGHPAISIPAGFLSNGLPFGLQLVGPRFGDALLLDVAARFEAGQPWRLVAPGYKAFGADFESAARVPSSSSGIA